MATNERDKDKQRALDSAMHQIEKDFGKGSIMRLGEASAKMNVEVIPTGAITLFLCFWFWVIVCVFV